jgi:drug/metabolite transporter (DMT)-like permease
VRVATRASIGIWLGVGVLAVSTSPILIRLAAVPAVALAFWRCFAGAAVLAAFARPGGIRGLARADLARMAAAGVFLAAHFALWNASLGLTSVGAATTLVSCTPLFVGIGARFLGDAPDRRTWAGIALAMAGAVVIGLSDVIAGPVVAGATPDCCPTTASGLLGDALAFAGSAAMAVYLLLGRVVRRRLPVSTYAAAVYGTAAAVLLPLCLVTGASLGGYPAGSWLALAGVVAGPQLLGHTVFNSLLSSVSATVVSVVLLVEPIIATVLAWWVFGELPATGFFLGAPLVLVGSWLAIIGEQAAAASLAA